MEVLFDEYEINKGTQYIQGINRDECFISDEQNEGIFPKSVVNLMNKSCINFGSTLIGRNEGATILMGMRYKPPIVVSEALKIVFFPCASFRRMDCLWFNLKKIRNIYGDGKGTIIEFTSGKRKYFSISSYIVLNQYNKALKLYYRLFE